MVRSFGAGDDEVVEVTEGLRLAVRCSLSGSRGGRDLADPDERVLVREAVVERAHVDDDVVDRREVRQRLDADVVAVLGETADARKLLAPVHAHAARAARGVQQEWRRADTHGAGYFPAARRGPRTPS
jgi:hypothetical protein